jgi:hypothetical protein
MTPQYQPVHSKQGRIKMSWLRRVIAAVAVMAGITGWLPTWSDQRRRSNCSLGASGSKIVAVA